MPLEEGAMSRRAYVSGRRTHSLTDGKVGVTRPARRRRPSGVPLDLGVADQLKSGKVKTRTHRRHPRHTHTTQARTPAQLEGMPAEEEGKQGNTKKMLQKAYSTGMSTIQVCFVFETRHSHGVRAHEYSHANISSFGVD